MACSRARCSPAPPASCATRRRPRAICCSGRAVPIFTTPTSRATNASPAAAARAIGGFSRQHAVVGVSDACIATHPSDMAVAMRVLDATVETVRPDGSTRSIPIADFHRLPGDTPHIETVLEPGELITAVTSAEARRRHAHLPQGARPRLLRLRAGFGRQPSSSATAPGAWRWAAWRTSRGGSRPPKPKCRAARRPLSARLLAGAAPTRGQRIQVAAGRAHAGAVLAEAKG